MGMLKLQVAKRRMPGEVRLAATWECVSPQQHDCTSFCHPVGGELSAELGICQCHKYVSAEELCDAQCLAQALQLSLAWGPSRELILSVKNEAGDSIQMEVSSTLSPDQLFQGSASIHLVQFSPRGIFGFIISRADVLDSFLLGPRKRLSCVPGAVERRIWQRSQKITKERPFDGEGPAGKGGGWG
ncbi:uncharacterized protein LOC135272730 isoform X2 [Aotus nancymaae]|uniref:uncharacterized protein LOC135272716 isoform X2 n=1 Tax=Aotus nancymaae TaxID=37293 RepID=UPI0030FE0AC0